MTNKLIVLGHGPDKHSGFDPGAKGNGTTEAAWLRGAFLTSLKKYAGSQIDFYEQNMYANREARTITGYNEIIELHLDAASSTVKGGHVIIYKEYKPDELDNRLGEVIEKHFGLRHGKMFSYRDDLYNLNSFASRGISYRLLELGFITNKENMDYFKANYDVIAKELVYGILNKSVDSVVTPVTNPKEEDEMLKQAIVIGSLNDYSVAEVLSNRINAPIYPRSALKGEVTKELIVVGGGQKGLEEFANKITNLSGKDRFDTSNNVKAYLKNN